MSKLLNLSGIYNVAGNYLTNIKFKFLIAKRKNLAPKKPVAFLLDKTTPSGQYISSLYFKESDNTGNEVYKFDFQGYNYVLKVNNSNKQAEIYESPSPIS
jgi:hypothetical protein